MEVLTVFRILIVDDDSEIRGALKAILTQGGHDITEAENGKVAQDLLSSQVFDLVISDLQMPVVNGLELLAWLKARRKSLPVILVTGFAQILETQRAFQLGADDFFSKPFSYQGILKSVDRLLRPGSLPAQAEDPGAQFCRIPIEDFVSSAGVQINVYIKLSDSKYVRVAHKGDQVPAERVESYKSKGLAYVYAKKEDFCRLVGFSMDLSHLLKKSSQVATEKKLRFLRYTTELVLENAFVNGINGKAFKQAADCLELLLSVVTENHSYLEVLEILNTHADWLYAHSLGVSLYSVMIGRRMGWTAQSTLFKLGVSGLFHDIGEKELPVDLLGKGRPALSLDERKQIESHAGRSKDILLALKGLPEDVLQAVYEHHEDCTGRGYPRQVSSEKIHPLAKIVAVADRFCYLAMVSPQSQGAGAKEALQQMQLHHSQELDKVALNALRSLCTDPEANSL